MVKRSASGKTGPADRGFVLDDYVMYNLVRTSSVYTNELASALKEYGLTTIEWRLLMLLHDKSPSSVSDLARRSVMKLPTVTRALTRMEEDGLVCRTALAGDRRVVEVTMTPKAVKTLRQVQMIGQKVFERAFEGVAPNDVAKVTQILKHVRANLQRSPYVDAKAKAS